MALSSTTRTKFVPTPIGPDNKYGKSIMVLPTYGYYIPITEKDPKGISYLLANLTWTLSDPEKPIVPYDQLVQDVKKSWSANFVPTVQEDWADLVDFWINEVNGSNLTIYTTEKFDLATDAFDGLMTTLGTTLFKQLSTYTPISQIVDSTKPIIDAKLDAFNK
jgi:hypothetical protein